MKRKGRVAKRIKKHYALPEPDQSRMWKMVDWVLGHEAGIALLIGLVFALYIILTEVIGEIGNIPQFLQLSAALLIFGVLVGVIVVTEENSKYATSGSRVRIISGAIAGGAIALIFKGDPTAVALSAFFGAFFGYFGKYLIGALLHAL